LVLPGSRARIVRCGGRYDPQLVKRSSEWVEWAQYSNAGCNTRRHSNTVLTRNVKYKHDEYKLLSADLDCSLHKSADEEIALYDTKQHLRLQSAQFITACDKLRHCSLDVFHMCLHVCCYHSHNKLHFISADIHKIPTAQRASLDVTSARPGAELGSDLT